MIHVHYINHILSAIYLRIQLCQQGETTGVQWPWKFFMPHIHEEKMLQFTNIKKLDLVD